MESKTAIAISGLRFRRGDRPVIVDLQLNIGFGESFGLLGAIGAGKTTLLRLIAGLEKPDQGEVRFFSPARCDHLSFVFQGDNLLPWLNVRENLEICRRSPEARLDETFGVGPLLEMKPSRLSGGMRQKVNFARAFLNEDPIVLMDEPFSALDPVEKRELQQAFLQAQSRSKPAIVLVTHEVRDALLVCDRIGLLSKKSGSITSVLNNPFCGRFDEHNLFADPGYRSLNQRIIEFFESEGRSP